MSHDLGQPECNFAKNLEDGPSLAYFTFNPEAWLEFVPQVVERDRQIISIFKQAAESCTIAITMAQVLLTTKVLVGSIPARRTINNEVQERLTTKSRTDLLHQFEAWVRKLASQLPQLHNKAKAGILLVNRS